MPVTTSIRKDSRILRFLKARRGGFLSWQPSAIKKLAAQEGEAMEKLSRSENKVLMVNEYVGGGREFVFTSRCIEVSA